jgi:glucose-6-phosphate isomerase
MTSLAAYPAWHALQEHYTRARAVHIRDLFAGDPGRGTRFAAEAAGIYFDYSKHAITDETLRLLVDLARAREVEHWRDRMFAGEPINNTENRAAWHVALRAASPPPEVREMLGRMGALVEQARGGAMRGATGAPVRTVVNLGIGGSDLGPRMAVRALRAFNAGKIELRFVANIDPADLDAALAGLDPRATFFIVTSKTFTTLETLDNARRARAWLARALGGEAGVLSHFIAVTANVEAARAFGIAPERCLPMWDWVGGRFSLWSAVGLPIALAVGMDGFARLLAGARAMDEHFRTAPLEANVPVLTALLGVWYVDLHGAQTHAVLPYAEDLRELPGHLQQLEMESNGKRVDRDGHRVAVPTAPVVWGMAGTNGQHAFHQLLHQGTVLVPCDFIVAARGAPGADDEAHRHLLLNALAQSAALAFGKNEPGAPHRHYPGNQPSSTIVLPQLEPYALGALLALYEHKVLVQGVIWGVNSFDQWGVELGKTMARALGTAFAAGVSESLDGSTRALIARIRTAPRES